MWWVTLGIAAASGGCLFRAVTWSWQVTRGTSLRMAARWLATAGAATSLMVASDPLFQLWPNETADYGWCLTAIVLLCPPMAVLGARRPGVRVWSIFILGPMVAVLSWPIWTLLLQSSEWRGLSLEVPTVLGFVLVLTMGVGNFLGTRFALSAVLYFAGVLGLFMMSTGWNVIPASWISTGRLGAVMMLNTAVLWGASSTFSPQRRHRVNQVWDDFRDLFGVVWALRMVERINAVAVQEHWTIRMSLDGFPETPQGRLTSDEAAVEAACRWLFRRFVEDEWIARRLDHSTIVHESQAATTIS